MAETTVATALLIAASGGAITAAIQYGFRRYDETQQQRRELIETQLLQLQNSAESLYYRANNLLGWSGKSVMGDDYYLKTSVFAIGRVLAHEQQLIAKGVYAKLRRSTRVQREIKKKLHAINLAMDDQVFLHYHRVLLAEMLVDGDRLISFGEFLKRWSDPAYVGPVSSVGQFVGNLSEARLKKIQAAAGDLVELLERETQVPSALTLTTGVAS